MEIKKEYKDSILFFRLGDFYEMFFEDAILASKELEITLTQRDCGMDKKAPMCGIPHHVADGYVAKLVEKGYKVAICEQVEDPATAKGIVKREVIKVVTPGTITDTSILDDKSNNFLASIYLDDLGVGIAYVDNSTGEMYTTELLGGKESSYDFLLDELGKIFPSEVICNEEFTANTKFINVLRNSIDPYMSIYSTDDLNMDLETTILKQFNKTSLEELGLGKKILATIAIKKLIDYLFITQKSSLDHINNLNYYEPNKYMILDINTRANLEIHETIIKRDRKGALIGILDKTSTSMGGRLLKKWLDQPLIDIREIEKRLNIVEYFVQNIELMDDVKSY